MGVRFNACFVYIKLQLGIKAILCLVFFKIYMEEVFRCFLCLKNSGLKEYISANPALKFESATTVVKSKFSHVSIPNGENEEEAPDEFYDAIGGDSSSSDEESDDDEEFDQKVYVLFFEPQAIASICNLT